MQNKKKIKGLETVDDQLAIFDSIPYIEQLQWMVDGINDTTNLNAQWDAIIQAYKSEDLETISTLMNEGDEGLMKYEDVMIINRNKNGFLKLNPSCNQVLHLLQLVPDIYHSILE